MNDVLARLWKEERAQGATEYLLIAAGAIAVATAVGLYIKSIPQDVGGQIEKANEDIINN